MSRERACNSAPLTIERACEILNEAQYGGGGWVVDHNHVVRPGIDQLRSDHAIAIATGILDRKQVVKLEAHLISLDTILASHHETTQNALDELARVTQERDALQNRLKECDGEPLAANPSRWPHRSQIAGLRHTLHNAQTVLRCKDPECNFALKGPYMPPSFCAKCQRNEMLIAEPVLTLMRELAALRLAVEPVARLADDYDTTSAACWLDGYTVAGRPGKTAVTVGDLRAIRALLATEHKEGG